MDAGTLALASSLLILLPLINRVFHEARARRDVKALHEQIQAFSHAGLLQEAVHVCDEFLRRFGDADAPETREILVEVLVRKCALLTMLRRGEETLRTIQEIGTRFGAATEVGIREQVASLPALKGSALVTLGRFDDALLAYEQAIGSVSTRPGLAAFLAEALTGKSFCLAKLGRREDAILGCEQVISIFGKHATHLPLNADLDPTQRHILDTVTAATCIKGTMLSQLGREDESMLVLGQSNGRQGCRGDLGIRDVVAKALAADGEDKEAPANDAEPQASGSLEPTRRVTMGMYLDENGDERHLEVPGWVGVIPHLAAAGVPPTRRLGQLYVERPYPDLATAPAEITSVDLRSTDGNVRMVQEFVGRIEDEKQILERVSERIGPDMPHWRIVAVCNLRRR